MTVVSDISTDARVRKEARTLAAVGHEVRVLAFDYSLRRAATRVEDGVEYRLLPFPPRDSSRPRRVVGAGVFFLRASAEVLASKADVYHSHNLHLVVPCMVAAARPGALLAYDAHELTAYMHRGMARQLINLLEAIVWRRASAVITTNASRARFLQHKHGGRPPWVIGNYPETPDEIRPADFHAELGIPCEARILIYQGGFYMGARCFEEVARAIAGMPAWHWVIAGFGSMKAVEGMKRVVKDAGIEDRAHVLPPVSLDRLLDLTAGADVGVVPLRRIDLNNYLGDTNKLFEYLMVGLPAIGSDFPEVRRAILDNGIGPVGAVFEPDDPKSIADALGAVEANLPALSARASQVARNCYSWSDQADELLALYSQLDFAAR